VVYRHAKKYLADHLRRQDTHIYPSIIKDEFARRRGRGKVPTLRKKWLLSIGPKIDHAEE